MNKSKQKPIIVIILSLLLLGSIIYGFYHACLPDNNKLVLPQSSISHKAYNQCSPNDLEFYENAFKFNKRSIDLNAKIIIGGIIPHHLLAADLIAEFFYNIDGQDYGTVILIGPNHFSAGTKDIITSPADWQTPYGVLSSDKELLESMMTLINIEVNDDIIKQEHAISSEVAFIKKTFPGVKLLPIILKSNTNIEKAHKLGEGLYKTTKNKKILVLASVDFSHYQDNETTQINDRASIDAIKNYFFDKLYDLDIDSPPAITTLLKYSQMSGAEFQLLNNSNSAILLNKPELKNTTSYVTGFFVKSD